MYVHSGWAWKFCRWIVHLGVFCENRHTRKYYRKWKLRQYLFVGSFPSTSLSNCFWCCYSTYIFFWITDYYDDFLATLSLQLIGWVGVLVAMVIMIVFSSCLPNKILGWVAAIFSLVGGKHLIQRVQKWYLRVFILILCAVVKWSPVHTEGVWICGMMEINLTTDAKTFS